MAKKKELTTEEFEKLLKNELDLTINEEEQENEETLVEETDTEEKEEIEEEIEIKEVNKTVDYKGRGFKTLEDAIDFPNTETFKRLGDADKQEYLRWLEK